MTRTRPEIDEELRRLAEDNRSAEAELRRIQAYQGRGMTREYGLICAIEQRVQVIDRLLDERLKAEWSL